MYLSNHKAADYRPLHAFYMPRHASPALHLQLPLAGLLDIWGKSHDTFIYTDGFTPLDYLIYGFEHECFDIAC